MKQYLKFFYFFIYFFKALIAFLGIIGKARALFLIESKICVTCGLEEDQPSHLELILEFVSLFKALKQANMPFIPSLKLVKGGSRCLLCVYAYHIKGVVF